MFPEINLIVSIISLVMVVKASQQINVKKKKYCAINVETMTTEDKDKMHKDIGFDIMTMILYIGLSMLSYLLI